MEAEAFEKKQRPKRRKHNSITRLGRSRYLLFRGDKMARSLLQLIPVLWDPPCATAGTNLSPSHLWVFLKLFIHAILLPKGQAQWSNGNNKASSCLLSIAKEAALAFCLQRLDWLTMEFPRILRTSEKPQGIRCSPRSQPNGSESAFLCLYCPLVFTCYSYL